MKKYGVINSNGELEIVSKDTQGAKEIQYDDIPEFNQTEEAVFEKDIIEEDNYIRVTLEIREVIQDDSEEMNVQQ